MLLSPMLTDETPVLIVFIFILVVVLIELAVVIAGVIWFIRNKKKKDK